MTEQTHGALRRARGGLAEAHPGRSVVEMAIEKNETTAMRWLQNRPKTIDNDVKEKYKTSPPETCGEKGM